MAADEPEVAPDPHAFWSGTLTFGLVSIPVDLYPAVRSRRTPLRTLGAEAQPVVRRYYCSRDDAPLRSDDLVRGYENDDGTFTIVEDEELEALAPQKSRDIDLRRFVARDDLPRQFLERPYILAPAGRSTKAYFLLAATMERSARAGIATFVMREKEYLAAIFAEEGTLRAVTMRFASEVRTPEDLGLPPVPRRGAARAREMARAIAALSTSALDTTLLTDEYATDLRALAEKKLKRGIDVVEIAEAPEAEAEDEGVIDIMKILRERMGAAPGKRSSAGGRKGRHAHPVRERLAASKPAHGSRGRRRTRSGTSRTP